MSRSRPPHRATFPLAARLQTDAIPDLASQYPRPVDSLSTLSDTQPKFHGSSLHLRPPSLPTCPSPQIVCSTTMPAFVSAPSLWVPHRHSRPATQHLPLSPSLSACICGPFLGPCFFLPSATGRRRPKTSAAFISSHARFATWSGSFTFPSRTF
ncbi:hypothetical protein GGS23DRAFT_349015 [Durotheca rogersii]|uniref:uncharacterized protein n=1 Tax=Durotheca rogersii TaxID=419775 RepID=UPI00221EC929|nr:uncharacterized protein GGS23DRAFT_349015 [Durotheca rogersii]KAI5857416.1 hypothetical protein GGS23DRAFT_349015 [Durotheca rogersii]